MSASDEALESYSGLYSARAQVFAPESEDALRAIFARAKAERRHVTIRSGGHSFDAQALGDFVVSMKSFDKIDVHADRKLVTVGAGATWGAILAKLQPHGLVPAVTVTTQHASAGGTLAGDCLSRFSPAWGKEGQWVESFKLLTPRGDLLTCTAPPANLRPGQWTDEQSVFVAAIGGLGYIGAFIEITYKLLDVGQTAGRIGVTTTVRKYGTFDGLASMLVSTVRQTYGEVSDARDPKKHDAIYAALHTTRRGRRQTLLFTSAFTTSSERRRSLLFRPDFPPRVIIEWLIRLDLVNRLLWWLAFRFGYRRNDTYVDDLAGFTFFMDGNVHARKAAKRFGVTLKTIQQTFIIPSTPGSDEEWGKAKDQLVKWLEHARSFLAARNLTPTVEDVLFLPSDLPFPLSATADMAGFAVSYAFETNNTDKIERAKLAFAELADTLWNDFGGRVYLVKNVHASQQTLAKMYATHAPAFFAVKHKFDPDGILQNGFLDRTFGHLLAASRPAGSPRP